MDANADELIEMLKRQLRVETDEGLAERLHVGRSTVTSWRRRGSVPERYVKFASETPTSLPDFLDPRFDPAEKNALILALVRLIRGGGAEITADYKSFLSRGPFLPAQMATGLEKALLDITARMEAEQLEDARQALNLIVYDEFFATE